jgi:alpha-glucosidase
MFMVSILSVSPSRLTSRRSFSSRLMLTHLFSSTGTWSGDNLTTWYTMRRSISLTLSIGLSFGPGLYGHDIGGFEGPHNPSPELLVRWAQLGAWHTRFVVHSNKPVSTTLWMYKSAGEEGRRATEILKEVVGWRYRLIPMMYSLFVSHWMRRGWPVVKVRVVQALL